MANEYLVNSADMIAVADAIRTKGGTSDALTFPGGFVDAVGAIEAGGGGSDDSSLKDIIERTAVNPTLPDGLTSIGNSAFRDCRNLALTSLPGGLTSIGNSAFYGCRNLALTSLPDGLTSIGENAFRQCGNLALTSLPDGLTRIENNTFQECNVALTSFPAGLTSIGDSAFYGCKKLSRITFPSGLTRIGYSAFNGCQILSEITFTGTPTGDIRGNAFTSCSNLATINVPWAEGEVANAPWGATNATINYNYVA